MTRIGNTRSPSLEEVLRMAVHQRMVDVHTAMPGRVERYDEKEQKADVKPLLKRTVINDDGTEISESLPVIPDVPVMFPRAGGFFITFPIKQGDNVLLVFCERSIDKYTAGAGTEVDPVDLRMHDLSDAVAFPAFRPFSKAIKGASADDMVLGQENEGAQVTIKDGGKLEVTYDGGSMLLIEGKDSSAKLTLGDGAKHVAIAEALAVLWGSLKTALDTFGAMSTGHTHSTPAGESLGPTVGMTTPSWDNGIKSTKVSIPDG
jgi:hypothetical protein